LLCITLTSRGVSGPELRATSASSWPRHLRVNRTRWNQYGTKPAGQQMRCKATLISGCLILPKAHPSNGRQQPSGLTSRLARNDPQRRRRIRKAGTTSCERLSLHNSMLWLCLFFHFFGNNNNNNNNTNTQSRTLTRTLAHTLTCTHTCTHTHAHTNTQSHTHTHLEKKKLNLELNKEMFLSK